ncbi:thioredoxin [Tessaracoccus sp. Z1128]
MSIVTCVSCAARNRVPASAAGLPRCARCKADLPWLVDGSDADFDQVAATRVPVLVDLWAPWCGPCRMVAPILEKLSQERAGRLKVVKVNVDDNRAIQSRFGAMSIPTMVLLRDGTEVSRQVGALPKREIERWLDQHAS